MNSSRFSVKAVLALGFTALALTLAVPKETFAGNFSFTGNFSHDNDVQTFNFTVGATSDVILKTLSYAGGTNSADQTIPRGGFDPILALFKSSGQQIGENDDGPAGTVPVDPLNGFALDTFLEIPALAPGAYTVSIQQYDNLAVGPNLSDGFTRDGPANANFTLAFAPEGVTSGFFYDRSESPESHRDSHWAFDILNVNSATQNGVPEPATLASAGIAVLVGLGIAWRRKRVVTTV